MPCWRELIFGACFGAILAFGATLIDFSGTPEVIGGATALCKDGNVSMSESRQGVCSHHGGVKRWME